MQNTYNEFIIGKNRSTNQPTMTIKLTSDSKIIEITIEEDANIFMLTNAFRALAFAQGYHIDSINKAMLKDDN